MRFTSYWEAGRIALQSLSAHKLRTFLTLLGIIVSVTSVTLVGATIEGLENYVLVLVSETLGSNSFVLSKFPRFGHISEKERQRIVRLNKDLKLEDVDFLKQHCGVNVGREVKHV